MVAYNSFAKELVGKTIGKGSKNRTREHKESSSNGTFKIGDEEVF